LGQNKPNPGTVQNLGYQHVKPLPQFSTENFKLVSPGLIPGLFNGRFGSSSARSGLSFLIAWFFCAVENLSVVRPAIPQGTYALSRRDDFAEVIIAVFAKREDIRVMRIVYEMPY
jgi:hypothetical protein